MSSSLIWKREVGSKVVAEGPTRKYLKLSQAAVTRTIGSDHYPFNELWMAVLWTWAPARNLETLGPSTSQAYLRNSANAPFQFLFGLMSGTNSHWNNASTNHYLGIQVQTSGSGQISQATSAASHFYWTPAITVYKVENSVPAYISSVTNYINCEPARRTLIFLRFVKSTPWTFSVVGPWGFGSYQDNDYTEANIKAVLEEPDWTTLNAALTGTYGLVAAVNSTVSINEATYGNLDSVVLGCHSWTMSMEVDVIAGIKKS